jgi:hypothetical protein
LGLERFVSVRADAQYNFARDLVGNVFGDFHYSDPVNIREARGIEDQRRHRAGTGLTYLPLRWMALNLTYQYSKYDGDVSNINTLGSETSGKYEENRVMFTITLQPDQPLWRYGGI